MDIKDIRKYLETEIQSVEEMIESSLKSDIPLLDITNKSILSHRGKMMRPIMAILIAKVCSSGRITEDTLRFAVASELLHNATLLHDDVADDSYSRRGVPTVMSILGGRVSVLLGDYWLVKAVDRILQSDCNKSEVIMLFANTLKNLAEGEMLQLDKASSCDTEESDYYRIIYNKTASLFEAAAVSAAISVKADEEKIKAAKDYAVNIGMAFQIRDDIFDYEIGNDSGKPTGIDIKEQKITLPLLGALYSANEQESKAVRRKVLGVHEHPEYQQEIIQFVFRYKGIDYAVKKLEEFLGKAIKAIEAFPDGEYKEYLTILANYVGIRER